MNKGTAEKTAIRKGGLRNKSLNLKSNLKKKNKTPDSPELQWTQRWFLCLLLFSLAFVKMCVFSLFCLSKSAFCLSGFFYFHIYCILFEMKGQGWVPSLPGLVCVCGGGQGALSRQDFLCQLWNEGCMEAQGHNQHRGEQKEDLINPRTPAWPCAVLCSVAGSKVCRAGIPFWRLSNLKLLKIFHWPLSDDLPSKWRIALRCCPQTSLYRFGLGVLERTGN